MLITAFSNSWKFHPAWSNIEPEQKYIQLLLYITCKDTMNRVCKEKEEKKNSIVYTVIWMLTDLANEF